MIDDANDEAPEFTDDELLTFTDDAERELTELLRAWATKHVKCNWWEPEGRPERHEIPR